VPDSLLLVVDFGLVVLIWLTQLVVYPSFLWSEERSFPRWHGIYTRRISLLVVPLMLGQAALHGIRLATSPTAAAGLAAAAIVVAWVVTFAFAVPCHRALNAEGRSAAVIRRLIRWNWWRTSCWTLAFVLTAWDAQ
jgi:hypothetical protein